jgi:uncharacterized protein
MVNYESAPPFHLAIAVLELEETRLFYTDVLGCREGRRADNWIDFDFFGHQLVCHRVAGGGRQPPVVGSNSVDGDTVPVPHFGVVLEQSAWRRLSKRLRSAGIPFLIEPRIRFSGEAGEQGTMFVRDPSGNILEFKTFQDISLQLFAH